MHLALDRARLNAALDALAAADPALSRALARIGYPEPRIRAPGFPTLLRIIVAQQLSTASAAAIWRKLEAALDGPVGAEGFLLLDEAALRACGFSARKAAYGRNLARAVADGTLAVEALAGLADDEVIARITVLPGFGRWSAEIYLLFALGRSDVFPADDLALQVAMQRLRRLDARPTAKQMRDLATPWSPHRGPAAIFLWHYYGAATLDEAARG
jgi:DNA-3-methyladenine glycosylase II